MDSNAYVWGAGLGVNDLELTTRFFLDFMDMEIEAQVARAHRHETVLRSKAKRGSRVILMCFDGGCANRDVPAKLLFLVKDVAGLYARFLAAGYASNFPPVRVRGVTEAVAQIKGPAGYAIEISQFATEESVFVALGIGVSDPGASEAFFAGAFGMQRTSEYPLGGTRFGSIELPDETVVQYPRRRGASIVLMNYRSPGYQYKNNPVKSVHRVPDVPAALSKVEQAGGAIVEASELGGKPNALVTDPDGYLLELTQT